MTDCTIKTLTSYCDCPKCGHCPELKDRKLWNAEQFNEMMDIVAELIKMEKTCKSLKPKFYHKSENNKTIIGKYYS